MGSKEETEALEKRNAAQATKMGKLESGEEFQEETMNIEGVDYKVATIFSPRINREYVPASDLKELEVIGTDRWVKQIADQGEEYSSYKPRKTRIPDEQLQRILRRIAIQYMTHSQLSEQQQMAIAKDPESGQAWFNVPLTGHDAKSRIAEKIRQLTKGCRISDFDMSKATRFEHVYRAMSTIPEAKKLTQAAPVKVLRTQLPNVTVHTKRQTPIDKEKDIGRWKIIEAELERRNLPITGSRWKNAKINSMVKVQQPRKLGKTKKGTRVAA
ncbi:hypothetical protein AMS68_001229 [Peltaster fructicola]|uniref:Uncharacterized protein n=1 Tax=Peltaster fructicola TaxID=286661 RepID=A0A6H0XLT6_9PEZI|nr:hypothetical protein AMS68_001229 [Peltaster fructicola]